ncbi:hypothetical protein ACSBL2_19595 [Pedobacter sp. AW31-3R]|uniref:hypothetical protein n=1 Tax=Pedobacter sp. AW31-3R TaxID=3445781 RepID=UPI003FA0750F
MENINKQNLSSKDEILNELMDKLIQNFSPQCIISFHETLVTRNKKGCYANLTNTAIHYFLLMIVTPDDEYPCQEVWNFIKKNCPDMKVTILTHRETEIKDPNNINRYFFDNVFKNGVFLFKKNDLELPHIPYPDLQEISHNTILVSNYTLEMAQAFRDFAELNLGEDRNLILPFMFNSAIQYACAAMIHTFMNYKTNMLDLEWLIGLTTCFSDEPAELLHTSSPQEKELFDMLQNKEQLSDNEIDNYDAHYLFVRVMAFIEMAELLCRKKINELQQNFMPAALTSPETNS